MLRELQDCGIMSLCEFPHLGLRALRQSCKNTLCELAHLLSQHVARNDEGIRPVAGLAGLVVTQN
eukprot:3087528-Alexandrium_andersonii.AAC.1